MSDGYTHQPDNRLSLGIDAYLQKQPKESEDAEERHRANQKDIRYEAISEWLIARWHRTGSWGPLLDSVARMIGGEAPATVTDWVLHEYIQLDGFGDLVMAIGEAINETNKA